MPLEMPDAARIVSPASSSIREIQSTRGYVRGASRSKVDVVPCDGNKKSRKSALSRDKNRLTVEIVTGRSIFLRPSQIRKRGREGEEEIPRKPECPKS